MRHPQKVWQDRRRKAMEIVGAIAGEDKTIKEAVVRCFYAADACNCGFLSFVGWLAAVVRQSMLGIDTDADAGVDLKTF